MSVEIIFETHSITTDNEAGIATGWNDGRLSDRGRALAVELAQRRRDVDVVLASDLGRALETIEVAFGGSDIPVQFDCRLRECNYGDWNGMPVEKLEAERPRRVAEPFPGGESYEDVVVRMADFLEDISARLTDRRVMVVGHTATRWALDHLLNGAELAGAVTSPFEWREGWRYFLRDGWRVQAEDIGQRNLTVRPARPHEAEVLFRLQRSSAVAAFAHIFDPAKYPFPDDVERARWTGYVTAEQTTVLVAEAESEPVGVAVVDGDELRLFVAPERWGAGIGTRLHDAIIELMHSQGRAQCRLWVVEENHQARSFYERRGWRPDGRTRISGFPPHPPAFGYTLELAPTSRAR